MMKRILLIGLFLLWTANAWSAVTLDVKAAHASNAPSSPFSFTSSSGNVVTGTPTDCSSSNNRVMIAYFGSAFNAPSSVAMTWNGTSMTQIATQIIDGFSGRVLYMFGLKTYASGANTLSATWTGTIDDIVIGLATYCGVDVSGVGWTDSTTAANTNTTATGTVANMTTGDIAVAFTQSQGGKNPTISAGTSLWSANQSNSDHRAGYRADNGTITWTLTSGAWGWIGVRLPQASGGAAASGFAKQKKLRLLQ